MGKINRIMLYVAVDVLILAVIAFSCLGFAQARYNNGDISSYVYGTEKVDVCTMSEEGKVFDFGIWQLGQGDSFSSTVIIESRDALRGTLRFSLDEDTADVNDIAIQIDGVFSSSHGEYTVNEEDGRLELPFSVFISPTNRVATAYLDVEWIENGSSEVAMSSRYLMALNAFSIEDKNAVTVDQNNTKFLTNDLLNVAVEVTDTAEGVILAPGSIITNKFSAGMKYYTDQYPQGVILLKSSALYFSDLQNGKLNTVLDLGDYTAESPISLTAGFSESKYVVTSQTPLSVTKTLTVSVEKKTVLSHTKPLTVTLEEAAALSDNEWNVDGSEKSELEWQIERLVNGKYVAVETSKNLTVSKKQTNNTGELVLSTPTGDQPAGTYRIKFTQKYNGYTVGTEFSWFFIDYR